MSELSLQKYAVAAREGAAPIRVGRLVEAVGLVLEAQGCHASIGDRYEIRTSHGAKTLEAEVVGVRGDRTLLMPLGDTQGLEIGSWLRPIGHAAYVPVGVNLVGRVVDGMGRPIDGKGELDLDAERPLHGVVTNPLQRRPVEHPFYVGVRAVDGLLTLGQGQRMGIFAGAGVGKSSLLGLMVRNAEVDVVVVALIGERAREVEEFCHRILGEEGLRRAVVVAATSAEPPLTRVRGALFATAIAEYFRVQGLRTLLVMDSLTRYAMALRDIGLAAGEPPTTKGYTPSVFNALARLIERAGTCSGPGSITGIYTVLVEGDDLSDPIADSTRAILDGHIVLTRELAERGHFPAIDVMRSVSRVMPAIVPRSRMELAQRARKLLSTVREAQDLLAIGAYRKGVQPALDDALERLPALEAFLIQNSDEVWEPSATLQQLERVWS